MPVTKLVGRLAVAMIAPAFVLFATATPPLRAASGESLSIEPNTLQLAGPHARCQFVVTGQDSAGKPIDLTQDAHYECLSPGILTVDDNGRVTPLQAGESTVRVQSGSVSLDVPVTVTGYAPVAAVSFREDVIPVLTKSGCNQGACHAAQYGQGGFKLSLLGYSPEEDFAQLARDWNQRRISVLAPNSSLVLRKATLQTSHGGGRRFGENSQAYAVLKSWVEAGAQRLPEEESTVVDLTLFPTERVYAVGQKQQLRAVASMSDGSERDVTHLALYDSLGEGVASVGEDGRVEAIGPGQAGVMVRYQGQAKVSLVVSPYASEVEQADFMPRNFVDEFVQARWQNLGLEPSPICNDYEFIRRAYLDSIGTLPPPEDVDRFVQSDASDKRETLVDELLGLTGDSRRDRFVDEWSAYWTLKLGDLLRNNRQNGLGEGGMWTFHNWIRNSLREAKPFDQFVREIITAQGSIFDNGPANYYRISEDPTTLAETTAQVFLGLRLQCAKCHHHPFEVYSQEDYYSLAAFFSRVDTKRSSEFGAADADRVVLVKDSGSVRHPRTGQVMPPKLLRAGTIDPANTQDLRRPLAAWLTSPENPLFSRNMANRIWGYLMGKGIVEPIDDLRATNPPSHPELLDALAEHFVSSGYDLRQLMRVIMVSNAYQLSSTPRPENATIERYCTHYNMKRLPAEVLLDAIDGVCGTQEKFAGVPTGTRAIELPDSNYTSYFLDTLGRPKRAVSCECERTGAPNLAQVLQLANGDLINRKLSEESGTVARMVKDKASDADTVKELYRRALSRPPTDEELARCTGIIAQTEDHRVGLEDVLWAILNSREFLFNH